MSWSSIPLKLGKAVTCPPPPRIPRKAGTVCRPSTKTVHTGHSTPGARCQALGQPRVFAVARWSAITACSAAQCTQRACEVTSRSYVSGVATCSCLEGRQAGRCAPSSPSTGLIGPDWPCNTVTWGLVSVPSILFLIFVAPVLHIALVVVQALLTLVTFGSLALVSWSNPGILPAQSPEEAEDQRLQLMERGEFDHALCGHCNTWRSRGAIHCSANGVCVREYDHHCPWMGKAVAGNNLFFFYVFLYSMCTLLGVTGIGSLVWMMSGESAAIR